MPLFNRKPRPNAARLTPLDPGIEDTREARELEHAARHREAVRLVNTALAGQAGLFPEDRNGDLVDLCLELRSVLAPTPVGSRVIKELPPLLRPGAPVVVPGRSS
ncbi:hypothetical protein AB0M54_24480 [Actinoplanes sp. NPDC051470]|uniref:hypothetical protein n=1 Tax=Actinoplanes sp. NPDC051470 TaxID=3157224 RepID=UPI00342BF9AB